MVDTLVKPCYNTYIDNKELMMIALNDIRVGSRVVVRDNFGTGVPREVTVLEVDADIKNGRAGIDYDESWAYLTQVDRVIKY